MAKICDGSGTEAGFYLELSFMLSSTVLVFFIQYLIGTDEE